MRHAFLVGIVLLALHSPAAGQEDGMPRLGDHQFVPVPTIGEPFMTTFVQTQVELAFTFDSQLPLYNPVDSTQVGLVDVDQAFTALGFQYQQRVQDWLVVQTEFGFLGRLGTDTGSLVASGTRACTLPVAGLKTSPNRSETDGCSWPAIKWFRTRMSPGTVIVSAVVLISVRIQLSISQLNVALYEHIRPIARCGSAR